MSLYGKCIDCKCFKHCQGVFGNTFPKDTGKRWCAGFKLRLPPTRFIFNGKVIFDSIIYPNGDVTLGN